uniref:Uncharacterized protein n=1 Tax=Anopheles arabiensis TaxID=7173 RepID=A0A182HZD3_ANOAR
MTTPENAVPIEEEQEITATKPRISFPTFDTEDVETWFVCLEAAFYVNAVKLDKHKFNAYATKRAQSANT